MQNIKEFVKHKKALNFVKAWKVGNINTGLVIFAFFFLFFLLLPTAGWRINYSITHASGTGTVSDPYTTLAEFASASCGNTVYLKDGTYSGSNITLSQSCGSSNQLIFKCSNGTVESKLSCILNNAGIVISGTYITVDGFYFTANSYSYIPLEINGGGANYNTVTDCYFKDIVNGNGLTIGRTTSNNTHNHIIRNTFEGSLGGYAVRVRRSTTVAGNTNNVIDYNTFLNLEGNYPVIQLGDGIAFDDDQNYYTEVSHNLVESCNTDNGYSELMEIKTSSNYINYNIINESGGNISLRAGNNSEVIGNIFKKSTNSGNYFGGVRISGSGHKVINNYMEGYEAPCSGASYTSMSIIIYWGDNTHFAPVNNVLIANNTIKNTCRGYGMYQHAADYTIAPTNVTYINNLGESNVTVWNWPLFCGGVCSTDSNTWTTNRGHTSAGQLLKNASISGGVTDSGAYELTNQKTGLTINWYYPSVYTNGTYNENVLYDIEGQSRANPPDIGADEYIESVDTTPPEPPSGVVVN